MSWILLRFIFLSRAFALVNIALEKSIPMTTPSGVEASLRNGKLLPVPQARSRIIPYLRGESRLKARLLSRFSWWKNPNGVIKSYIGASLEYQFLLL